MSQKGKADQKKSNMNKADQKKDNLDDITVDKVNIDDFMAEVNQKSLEKMVKAGVILPQLKPRLDTIYTVKIIGNLSKFTSEYGKAYALEIEHNGMRKQMVFNPEGSFHLQLVALLTIHKVSLKQVKGRQLIIQKSKGNTKKFKDVDLYSLQFVKPFK